MAEFLGSYLPICIYILLIFLLIVGIILGVRLIGTINKVDDILDNVNGKVNSLNGLFDIIDFTTDKVSLFTDRAVNLLAGFVGRMIKRRRKRKETEEDEEDE